jgi:hypothetical protein
MIPSDWYPAEFLSRHENIKEDPAFPANTLPSNSTCWNKAEHIFLVNSMRLWPRHYLQPDNILPSLECKWPQPTWVSLHSPSVSEPLWKYVHSTLKRYRLCVLLTQKVSQTDPITPNHCIHLLWRLMVVHRASFRSNGWLTVQRMLWRSTTVQSRNVLSSNIL